MTAPLRRNGKLVAHIERGCENKRRYSCEMGARAAGMIVQQDKGERMWFYQCKICRGYHLTRNVQHDKRRAVDYVFPPTKKDRL